MADITGKKSGNIISLEGLDYGKKYTVVMTPTTDNLDSLGINQGVESEISFYSGVENKVVEGSLEKKDNNLQFTRFDTVLGADEYQVEFLELTDNLPYTREIKRFDSDFFSEKYELNKLGTHYSCRVYPMLMGKKWNQCWGYGVTAESTVAVKPQPLDISALNTMEDDRTLSVGWSYYDELYNNFKSVTFELFSNAGVPITEKYVLSNLGGLYQDITLSNPNDVFDNYPYMALKSTLECKSGIILEMEYKVTDGVETAWITDITTTSMRLNWNPVFGAHYYSIRIDKGGSFLETRTTADSGVFYDAQNLSTGTEYGFQVLPLDKHKRPLNNNNNYSPRVFDYTKLPNVINFTLKKNDQLASIQASNIIPEGNPDKGVRYEVQIRSISAKTGDSYEYDGIFLERETVDKANASLFEDGGLEVAGVPRGIHYEVGVRTIKGNLTGDFHKKYTQINIGDIKSTFISSGSGNVMRYGYEIIEGSNADNYNHMNVSFDHSKINFNNFGDIKTGNLLNMANNIELLSASNRVYYKIHFYSAHTDHPTTESRVYPSYVYTKKIYGDTHKFYVSQNTSDAGSLTDNKIFAMMGCNYNFRIYLCVETPGMASITSTEYIRGTIVFPMYNPTIANSLKSKTYISYRQTDSYKNHRARHIFGTIRWSGLEVWYMRSMMFAFKQGYNDKSYQYTYYSFNRYDGSFSRTNFKSKAINAGSGSGSFDCKYYNDCSHGTWQAESYDYYDAALKKFGLATKTMGGSHHDDYGWDEYRAGWIYFYGKNGTWAAVYNSDVTRSSYGTSRNAYKQS